MATKFYLPSSGAAALTPAYSASWYAGSASPEKLEATTTKPNSGLVTEALTDADLTDRHYYFGMWVSSKLSAQTIASQTITGSIRCSEDNAKNNMSLHLIIRVVQSDGTTYRGTLVSFTDDATEAYTSLRSLTFSVVSSELAIQDNDRIVIELGLGGDPQSGGGSHNSTMSIGETSAGADLDASDADMGADNPWVNFANTLTFFTGTYNLYGGTGAFSETGNNALLQYRQIAKSGTGTFVLTGNDAVLVKRYPLLGGTGSFVETGNNALLQYRQIAKSGTGAFTLTGNDATLTYTPVSTGISPIYIAGFEHGVATPTVNGGGLFSEITGTPVVDATSKRIGNYGLHLTPAENVDMLYSPTWTGNNMTVGRFYFCFHAWPTLASTPTRFDFLGPYTVIGPNICFDMNTSHKVELCYAGNILQTSSITCSLDTWYRVDFRINQSANPWVIDWQMAEGDAAGTAQTQGSYAASADTVTKLAMGQVFTAAITADYYLDDIVISNTSGDYPIGAGGVFALSPDEDGTHTGGANVIEKEDGTDIVSGYTTAHDLVNSVPIGDVTNYIRQVATGDVYAELLFADTTQSNIQGVQALLAYKASGATACSGACIIIDEDAVQTTLHGNPTTRADYSEVSVFYKKVMLPKSAGGWDTAAVNVLKARVGYSNNVATYPYWVDLLLEVAYSGSALTDYSLLAGTGAFVETGNNAILQFNQVAKSGAGSFTLAGNNVILAKKYPLLSGTGTFALTGSAAYLLLSRLTVSGAGLFILTGNGAILTYTVTGSYPLLAGTGVFTETGNNAIMALHHAVLSSAGSFAFTGNNAILLRNLLVLGDTGLFVFTGNNAILDYYMPGFYPLWAGAGEFLLVGSGAILRYNKLSKSDIDVKRLEQFREDYAEMRLTQKLTQELEQAKLINMSTHGAYNAAVKRAQELEQQSKDERNLLLKTMERSLEAARAIAQPKPPAEPIPPHPTVPAPPTARELAIMKQRLANLDKAREAKEAKKAREESIRQQRLKNLKKARKAKGKK